MHRLIYALCSMCANYYIGKCVVNNALPIYAQEKENNSIGGAPRFQSEHLSTG